MTLSKLIWITMFASILVTAGIYAETVVPDFKLKPDDYTILMAVDAKLSDGLTAYQPGAHGKFFIQGWHLSNQQAQWKVSSDQVAGYAVQVLINCMSQEALRLEVSAGGKTVSTILTADVKRWQRLAIPGILAIPSGQTVIRLRLLPREGSSQFDAQVQAVELVRPPVRELLHQQALALRADTNWLQQARYGIMVHWTSQSMPLQGDPKSYDQAVNDFNVEAFAGQIKQTGAGFVVFTTSHAMHYFPAPLASLDKILPDRTGRRDLIADLATALDRRGLKLLIYYHLGAASDPAWLQACGFRETDTSRFFNNWQSIITEAGNRYGNRLAGWWFDDGAVTYYYRSAPWEKLHRAARAGNPQRLVGFNPWELPSPTEFQDFFCGEGYADPGVEGLLPEGGDGHIQSGSHQGLQACATLVTESNWVHAVKDTRIDPPRWNATRMAELLRAFINHRNVPIFNLEIYQDGSLSPESINRFRQAREILEARQ